MSRDEKSPNATGSSESDGSQDKPSPPPAEPLPEPAPEVSVPIEKDDSRKPSGGEREGS